MSIKFRITLCSKVVNANTQHIEDIIESALQSSCLDVLTDQLEDF